MLSVFISGLQKQTGKTILTAGLAGTMQSLSYSTSVFKPVQTGANTMNGFLQSQDLALIKRIDSNIQTYSSYIFTKKSPPLIAAYESDLTKIELKNITKDFETNIMQTECHIIEGSDSIATPINDKQTETDIVKTLGAPLLLVVNPKKSTIDDVIMGVNYINNNKMQFLGIVINNFNEHSSDMEEKYFPALIKEYTGANILGTIPHYDNFETLTPETLIADILNNVQIEDIFGVKIAKLNQ